MDNFKKSKNLEKYLRFNATDAENILWYRLRNRGMLGYKFRRQADISKYIVDFLCVEKQLIFELDGGHHMDQTIADQKRTGHLENLGFKVIRFWNNEVINNLYGVLSIIKEELEKN